MPYYRYSASDFDGNILKGEADAADEQQLKDSLFKRKLFLIECQPFKKVIVTKPPSILEVADMCRQIGSMLKSGITVVKSITILLDRDTSENMKKVMDYMNKQVKLGNTLSASMRETDAFPPLLVSMIEAGEEGGNVEKIMLRMAEYYEHQYKTEKTIKSALAYPIFLAVLLVVAVIAIFSFIIPKFISVFDGVELPVVTQIVLKISDFLTNYWYVLIISAVVIFFVIRILLSIKKVKIAATKALLHMGKLGRLFGIIYTARFCRTFSELYSSGIPIIQCFQITKNTVGCPYIESQFDDIVKEIRQGTTIADALGKVDGFDSKLKSAVLIGEESGSLEFMLTNMAESFEFESDQAIKKLTGMIEPIMIVSMGILVAFVFVAVMMPVFSIYDTLE